MNRLFRIAALLALLPLGSCNGCLNQVNQNLDRYCDAQGCISVHAFSAGIDTALRNNVVGYVSIIGTSLAPLATVEYGGARINADGYRKFLTDVPMNEASVAKVLTTIAVLQSLKKHGRSLTDKIDPFLPPDWPRANDGSIQKITFQDLLTHNAGFRGGSTDYASLKAQIGSGVAATYAQPSYSNRHFAIFRIMLPYMEGFHDPGDPDRDLTTSKFYVDYMKTNVFQPVSVTDADTTEPTAADTKPALLYPFPAGSATGYDPGYWTTTCGGGGWVLTAADLYRVMISLLNDTVLLDKTNSAHLDKETMNAKCFGWDCSVRSEPDFVGKNGGLVYNTAFGQEGMQSFIGIFKGVVVVVVMNSQMGADIHDVVATAYANAKVP